MVRVIISLLTILISLNSYALSKVTASVDKNPVVVNESLILTVTADDDVDSNALDTSALLTDFIVGRTSVSSQTSMVNFNTTRSTTWTTVLIARKPGDWVIPAFNIAGMTTQPITITAIPASKVPASSQQDLFITSEVSDTEIYVQQQITLKVKLHFSAELKRGSLTEPSLAGANILQVGKDKESENIINGKRYRIIERVYAISPQQSGEVILKSPVFSGEIIMPSSRRSNFLSFAETKPVSIVGDDIPLSVKAIPTQISGPWLPSELVAVHQEWQPEPKQFKVGEPMTRTITLTAAGLSEEQLPEISMQVPAGLKVYPDQAELHTGLNNERLVSQKVVNFAIVASKAGDFYLPEIRIPWWNTVTNQAQVAIIAAEKITILPNPDLAPAPAMPAANTTPITTPTPVPVQTVTVTKNSVWQWLFLSLWLLTSLAWFISAKRPFTRAKTVKPSGDKTNTAHLDLMAACKQNNGQAALAALLPWARSQTSANAHNDALTTLDSLHAHFNDQALSAAIIELQQSHYGKAPSQWSGNNLLNAIQAVNKTNRSKAVNTTITLNP
ncbi:Oxygen tolerance [Colwellia chukchiensis]|uniref:Oxygen tolerance n=1 Tax=Colwellia chukchiensis TaxID=641665 RepID=A0A1H7H5Z6_9GAMM|nr:BatD family protein [Colwellia chukchiensis]SEK45658.1 Oxygen tolerance [Colwellia chukchiensis]